MADSYTAIPPLLHEEAPRSSLSSGKRLVLLSLFIGLSCAVLWGAWGGARLTAPQPITAVAMKPVSAPHSMPMVFRPSQPQTMRSRLAQAQKMYGIGSSPLEKQAISMVESANRCYPYPRDMRMRAETDEKSEGAAATEPAPAPAPAEAVNIPKFPSKPVEDDGTLQEGYTWKSEFPTMAELNPEMTEEDVKKYFWLKPKEMAGITGPLGFFDPLGFSTETAAGKLLFYREVELKHGRVCMLAALGILVGENFHPLFGGDIDVPAYKAFQQTPLQKFWLAVVGVIGLFEAGYIPRFNTAFGDPMAIDGWWTMKDEGKIPGDLGFDPLGLKPQSKEELLEMQNKEINNGRLAMIATAGMIAQELVTKDKILDLGR